jgi:hypothetical protein
VAERAFGAAGDLVPKWGPADRGVIVPARGAGPDAIRDATNDAVRQIEQFAEAQATWPEQVSLKDRALFLEEQKAPHDAWIWGPSSRGRTGRFRRP